MYFFHIRPPHRLSEKVKYTRYEEKRPFFIRVLRATFALSTLFKQFKFKTINKLKVKDGTEIYFTAIAEKTPVSKRVSE